MDNEDYIIWRNLIIVLVILWLIYGIIVNINLHILQNQFKEEKSSIIFSNITMNKAKLKMTDTKVIIDCSNNNTIILDYDDGYIVNICNSLRRFKETKE